MRLRHHALPVSAAFLALLAAGCDGIRAKMAFKDGNKNYKEENFRVAIEEYSEAVQLKPDFPEAHFFLGSSYQALYRPGKEDAENAQRLEKAIEHYGKSLEFNKSGTPNQKIVRTNTLAALTGIYSDPPKQNYDKAFEFAQQLLSEGPNDPKNLYAMANLYEKFGKVQEAEDTYRKVVELAPSDAKACGAMAAFYNKPLWEGRSKFDLAISTLERCAELQPGDPAGWHKVATFFWDKAYRDPLLNDEEKDAYADKGLEAIEKALTIKPDYWEAIIYKGLLYRVKAFTSKNPRQRQEFLDQAATLQKYALDLRKQQQAAAAEAEGGAALPEGVPADPSAATPAPEASPQS
jgi:tetratricopeptide (TPR) repeat protein